MQEIHHITVNNLILFLTAKQRTKCNCLPTLNSYTQLQRHHHYYVYRYCLLNYVNIEKTKRLVDLTDKICIVDRDYGSNIHYVIDGAEKIYTSRIEYSYNLVVE